MLKMENGRLIEPRSIFKATAVNHIAYGVADYARSRDFYMDLLGMRCTFDDGRRCSVACGTPKREIYIGPSRQEGQKPFVDHMAYSVADFNAEAAEKLLKEYGFEPRYDGDFGWTIEDLDGYRIQICAEEGIFPGAATRGSTTEGKVPAGEAAYRGGIFNATAVNHISYGVPDYARSRDFYVDLLGARVAFDDGLKCAVAFGPEPHDEIYIVRQPNGPVVGHYAFSVSDFDLEDAKQKLEAFGLHPEPDGDSAWTVQDPDGYRLQVCAETGVYPGAARDFFHQTRGK
jgi:catechol 2,3-dioxygenase-like lactoylglutathione lyase family enzyme